MHVRDAREADADALATMADAPADVVRNLVHDRTVRVAEAVPDDGTVDAGRDRYSGSEPDDLLGFVSFDAREGTVYVTQLDGSATACRRLLEEPIRFAERESMAVEALIQPGDGIVTDALSAAGFREEGTGPQFDGSQTIRFRLDGPSGGP